MLEETKRHIFRLFAGKDNHTLDLGRVLWALGTLVFFALSVHAIWHGTPFDPQSWGIGFSTVLAAGGLALWAKKDTEPESMAQIRRMQNQQQNDNNEGH